MLKKNFYETKNEAAKKLPKQTQHQRKLTYKIRPKCLLVKRDSIEIPDLGQI